MGTGDGFDAKSPLAVMLYVYLPGIAYGCWQMYTRSSLETTFSPQLASVAQPLRRTMLWFARLMTLSFALRAVWLFLDESEVLADADACNNRYDCWRVYVTFVNRSATFTNFMAYSLLVLLWVRWGMQTKALGGTARHSGVWDVAFLILVVWMALLQVVILLLTMVGGFSRRIVDTTLHDVYTGQVSVFLLILSAAMTYGAVIVVRLLGQQLSRYQEWQARSTVPTTGDLPIARPPTSDWGDVQLAVSPAAMSPMAGATSPRTLDHRLLGHGPLPNSQQDAARGRDALQQPSWCGRTLRMCCGCCSCCFRRTAASDVTMDERNPTVKLLRRARWVVVLTAVIVVPLLLIKAVLFAYSPLTGDHISGTAGDVLFPYFFYMVPEVIAGVYTLAITTPHYSGWLPFCGLCQRFRPKLLRPHAGVNAKEDDTPFVGDAAGLDGAADIDAADDPAGTAMPLLYSDVVALKEGAGALAPPSALRRNSAGSDSVLSIGSDESLHV